MSSPKITVIVLNWNGNEIVINCLRSLEKIQSQNVDVLVVDNNSIDGSRESIQKIFPNRLYWTEITEDIMPGDKRLYLLIFFRIT